jgi:hypothetical protein
VSQTAGTRHEELASNRKGTYADDRHDPDDAHQEIRGLLTVDLLIKSDIEKCILDIELTDRPRAGDINVENNPYSSGLDDRTECLIIINSRMLRVATNNPASLVSGETTI